MTTPKPPPAKTDRSSAIRKALALYLFGIFGVFLTVAPWTAVWYQAARGLAPEAILNVVLSGWVRGAVSAVGLVDLVIALQLSTELAAALRSSKDRRV